MSGGRMPRGMPSALMSSSSQVPSSTRSRPVVEALVCSARASPVSQYADEVGDQQRGVGELEDVAGLGGELVERVERQELQPVALEELGMRHPVVHGLHAEGRAGVAVVERVAEKAPAAQQPVVDGPGVDADARDAGLGAERLAQPLHGRPVERQDVPVQPVGDLHRVVREARDRCRVERVGPDVPDDDPAAGRAEVDRRDRAVRSASPSQIGTFVMARRGAIGCGTTA